MKCRGSINVSESNRGEPQVLLETLYLSSRLEEYTYAYRANKLSCIRTSSSQVGAYIASQFTRNAASVTVTTPTHISQALS
jgi:hypothetical protein